MSWCGVCGPWQRTPLQPGRAYTHTHTHTHTHIQREACAYAWELSTRVYGLPAERVWVSVYEDDAEALALWRDVVGVPAERIKKMGAKVGGCGVVMARLWGGCGVRVFQKGGEALALWRDVVGVPGERTKKWRSEVQQR
jgi:hypothetical protein